MQKGANDAVLGCLASAQKSRWPAAAINFSLFLWVTFNPFNLLITKPDQLEIGGGNFYPLQLLWQ